MTRSTLEALCSASHWKLATACNTGKGEVQRTLSVDGVDYTLHLLPKRSWQAAAQRCRRDGQTLVRLYSREQGKRVQSALAKHTTEAYYVGLTDADMEGTWVWIADGMELADGEVSWSRNEPNSLGDEDCGAAQWNPEDKETWIDLTCSSELSALCGPANITDVCARFPCTDPSARCVGSGTSMLADGRMCVCGPGFEYDDVLGCFGFESTRLDIGDGVNYLLFTRPSVTWEYANIMCNKNSSTLLEITGEEQALKLHQAILDASGGVISSYWLGLSDRQKEGTYTRV